MGNGKKHLSFPFFYFMNLSCEMCVPSYYNFGPEGCQFCHCNEFGAIDGKECHNVTGECQCQSNVIGLKCEECQEGFFNLTSGQGCQPCLCDSTGSIEESCEQRTGQCRCKPGVGGTKCDRCEPNYYGFGVDGCKRKILIKKYILNIFPLKSAEFVRHWAKFVIQSRENVFVRPTRKGKCANIARRMRGTIIHIEDVNFVNAMELGPIHKFAMRKRN